MSVLRQKPQAADAPAEPSEYDTFKEGLRQILVVPKSEIDRRKAEWHKAKEQKPPRKTKAA